MEDAKLAAEAEAAAKEGRGIGAIKEEDADLISEMAEKDLPVIPLSDKQEKKRKRKEKAAAGGAAEADAGEIEVVPAHHMPSIEQIAEVQAMGGQRWDTSSLIRRLR